MSNVRNPEPPGVVPPNRSARRAGQIIDDPMGSDEAGEVDTGAREMSEDEIDQNLIGSFPASDPPSWTLGVGEVDANDAGADTAIDNAVRKAS